MISIEKLSNGLDRFAFLPAIPHQRPVSLGVVNPCSVFHQQHTLFVQRLVCGAHKMNPHHPEDDENESPAGERAILRLSRVEHGQFTHKYWSLSCPRCPMRTQCTTSDYRRIARWEHEHVVESLDGRLEREPKRMRVRRSTAEHPFGTLKCWMGYTHFLTKTVPKVSTEMSLHVLAYNMKRMINILGHKRLIEAITV